jgi:hypothetical protein
MKRIVTLVALCSFAAIAEDKPAMPKPPEQLSAEKWFVGTWNCKGKAYAGSMGPEHPTASKIDFKMELAGFWLQVKGTITAGPYKGKEAFEGFASWDGTQHVRYDFQPGGGVSKLTTKGWDGDKLVFEGDGMMGGQKMALKHTITKKGADSWDSVFERDGKPMIEETCTRGGGVKK